MTRGFLIYYKKDFLKNKWFAERIIEIGKKLEMKITLYFIEDLVLALEGSFRVFFQKEELEIPDFVINRTRDIVIGLHFEKQGSHVFNSAETTALFNNKLITHQMINSLGIKSVDTQFCNKKHFNLLNLIINYPCVVKSASGHGGSEVFLVENSKELLEKIECFSGDEFLIQKMMNTADIDIRVYVIGNEIIAAVKRKSLQDFRSNISLGGISEAYFLSEYEKSIIEIIIENFKLDFVGVDFFLDENGEFHFNEIEDVVGTRGVYQNYEFDIVRKFLDYIKSRCKEVDFI